MKKLLLLSSGLAAIKDFTGKKPADIKMLFVPTAGNVYEDTWWIDKDRDVLSQMGFHFIEADITSMTPEQLSRSTEGIDIVYVAGGNTFHLLDQLRKSGFDKVLTEFVDGGGLFAGASAGALIAGADIEPIKEIDEPEKAPGLTSTKALGFINIVPIPHSDMAERADSMEDIRKEYGSRYELVFMDDDQAILVDGNDWKLIDSARNGLEKKWFEESHK